MKMPLMLKMGNALFETGAE